MNKLEREIEEYIVSTNIEQMTAKEVADKFYVSRAYLYKVIKKMGYSSYTDLKFEKRMKEIYDNSSKRERPLSNSKVIKAMNFDMYTSNVIFVIGIDGTSLVAQYFARQLMNLGQFVVCITDTCLLDKYLISIKATDTLIYFSNTGRRMDIHLQVEKCTSKYYVITKYNSKLYIEANKKIGFDNEVTNLSNKYDQENISMLLMLSHTLLSKFKNYILLKKRIK